MTILGAQSKDVVKMLIFTANASQFPGHQQRWVRTRPSAPIQIQRCWVVPFLVTSVGWVDGCITYCVYPTGHLLDTAAIRGETEWAKHPLLLIPTEMRKHDRWWPSGPVWHFPGSAKERGQNLEGFSFLKNTT
ncbi:hypothetical protein KIL84_014551 [Mauremys mutica]|uniref:Uncharacterized protein n=1 Tax=Mauremys mutica TaxID=74926 RepID=A0A9D3XRI6_9SAUR|nr:hypothetical protein KIL84_014551 [Mauremys mutica]